MVGRARCTPSVVRGGSRTPEAGDTGDEDVVPAGRVVVGVVLGRVRGNLDEGSPVFLCC
jgi:hypothetical protein